MKTLTRKQIESRKAKAVRFTRDVLEDEDRADEIEDESVEHYAERRNIKIKSPKGANLMEVRTRRELLDRVQQLEKENKTLRKNPLRVNQQRANPATSNESKSELLETIHQLEEENQALQSQLDEIADIVSVEEEPGE